MLDVKRLVLVREAIGEHIPIKLDFNRSYDVMTAIATITFLEKFGIQTVEHPTAEWDIEGPDMIRRSIRTPLIVDETEKTSHDL